MKTHFNYSLKELDKTLKNIKIEQTGYVKDLIGKHEETTKLLQQKNDDLIDKLADIQVIRHLFQIIIN
jgi:hypothetical protein